MSEPRNKKKILLQKLLRAYAIVHGWTIPKPDVRPERLAPRLLLLKDGSKSLQVVQVDAPVLHTPPVTDQEEETWS